MDEVVKTYNSDASKTCEVINGLLWRYTRSEAQEAILALSMRYINLRFTYLLHTRDQKRFAVLKWQLIGMR